MGSKIRDTREGIAWIKRGRTACFDRVTRQRKKKRTQVLDFLFQTIIEKKVGEVEKSSTGPRSCTARGTPRYVPRRISYTTSCSTGCTGSWHITCAKNWASFALRRGVSEKKIRF